MISLSLGRRRQDIRVATRLAWRARRARIRLAAVLLVAAAAPASVPPAAEDLVVERWDGRVRDVASCGRQKACLMRKGVAESLTPDAAPLPAGARVRRSRWSDAEYDAVTVWIAPGEGMPRWRGADRYMVRDAFHAWTAAGAPVRFIFVPDSLRANVRVLWRDSLPDGRAGQTTRFVDRRGWLHSATVEMSLSMSGARGPRPSMVRAIALHEVGHLIGLEHSRDDRDIMSAWVTARALTERDMTAMRALYAVADSVVSSPVVGSVAGAAGIPSGAQER